MVPVARLQRPASIQRLSISITFAPTERLVTASCIDKSTSLNNLSHIVQEECHKICVK